MILDFEESMNAKAGFEDKRIRRVPKVQCIPMLKLGAVCEVEFQPAGLLLICDVDLNV